MGTKSSERISFHFMFLNYLLFAISLQSFGFQLKTPSKSSHQHLNAQDSRLRMFSEENQSSSFKIRDLWPLPASCVTNSGPDQEALLLQAYLEDEDIASAAAQRKTIQRELVEYSDGDLPLYGLVAWPESCGEDAKLPGVLVAHTAVGAPEDLILWKLDALASLGYVAFALDMYGSPHPLWNKEESLAARAPMKENRDLLQNRALAGYNALASLPQVDSDRMAVLGYCFGGMCALDLMRADLPALKAAISFHGILDVPALSINRITPGTKVLLLHGKEDPFVDEENINDLKENLNSVQISWEMHSYDGAVHAFTRPEKVLPSDKERGLFYDSSADKHSWGKCKELLSTVFSPI